MPNHANPSSPIFSLYRARTFLLAAMLPLAITACAPDTSKSNAGGETFVKKVLDNCGSKHLGLLSISDLMNSVSPRYSPYFVQITSRIGQGAMSWDEYVRGVMTVQGGGDADSQGLSCIRALKP